MYSKDLQNGQYYNYSYTIIMKLYKFKYLLTVKLILINQ